MSKKSPVNEPDFGRAAGARERGGGELVLLLEAPDRLEQTGLAEGKLFLDGLDEVELALEMVPLDDEFPDQVHQGVELVDVDADDLLFDLRDVRCPLSPFAFLDDTCFLASSIESSG